MSTPLSCEQESIHTLGLIQSHGALLAFDGAGQLIARSHNAPSMLGDIPALQSPLTDTHLDAPARRAIARALAAPAALMESVLCTGSDGQAMDLVLHWSDGVLLAEWEVTAPDAPTAGYYAALLQRAIQRLHSNLTLPLNGLLQLATDAVQSLTGFDRVMAYRFLVDGSGQVAAESTRDGVESYLDLRYPAGDIPAQARRLYVLNLVRHIADTKASPVPIDSQVDSGLVLDLSQSTLRSVSPTHVTYLINMGVAASMSISIVVDGKLWGLIACHHLTPSFPSYAVRTSCTVLAQVLAVMVERVELSARTKTEVKVDALRMQVGKALMSPDDTIAALMGANEAMRGLIPSDAFSIVVGQRVMSFPEDANRNAALKVADFLTRTKQDMFVTTSIDRDASAINLLPEEQGNKTGILAIQMNADTIITVIWWRIEVVETINWAGARDKGVSGQPESLSPRTSFALWKEEVHGTCQAWSSASQYAARELFVALQELALNQMLAVSEEHAALLGIMGHDLRDPLQAIDMVVTLMACGRLSSDDGAKRIAYSSQRMQSLISYILDVSRLRTGVGLALTRQTMDLEPVLTDTLDEAALSHPGVLMTRKFEGLGEVMLDRDRFVQAISNLLSNARQHGDMHFPIDVRAFSRGTLQIVEIRNKVLPGNRFVPGPMTSQLKQSASINPQNKQGLGLGLYIAKAIIVGHGGTLEAECVDLDVIFRVTLGEAVIEAPPPQPPAIAEQPLLMTPDSVQ